MKDENECAMEVLRGMTDFDLFIELEYIDNFDRFSMFGIDSFGFVRHGCEYHKNNKTVGRFSKCEASELITRVKVERREADDDK